MSDINVKEESIEKFEDALRTLASAAIEHDSLSLPEQQNMQNELVPNSLQKNQVSTSAQLQLPQTVQHESKSMDTSVHNNSLSWSKLTDISVLDARWFDVGIVRKLPYTVSNFYFTETSIDHSADTSDNLPDYRGLRKLALLPGVAYKFRMAAINSCGIGEWSDVSAFKTCLPGYPGAPCQIRILKSSEGACLSWQPPLLRYGKIIEYSVCLGIKNQVSGYDNDNNEPVRDLLFVRVYCGTENYVFVENSSLKAAHIDESANPAIMFRIAARNEKGYGPATQVRWLQNFDRVRSNSDEAMKRLYS